MNPTTSDLLLRRQFPTFFSSNASLEDPSSAQAASCSSSSSIKKQKRKLEFLSDAQVHIRTKIVKNFARTISQSEINTFIANLLSHLDSEIFFIEAYALKQLQQKLQNPLKFPKIPSDVVNLAIVHEKNSILQILLSLPPEMIDKLKSVPLPTCYQDFFEELDYYKTIDKIDSFENSTKKINAFIEYAKKINKEEKKTKAIKLLDLAKANTDKALLNLHDKTKIYQTIANLCLEAGNTRQAAKVWLASANFISNFDMFPSMQLEILQEIVQHLICIQAWDEITGIIKILLTTPIFWNQHIDSMHPEDTTTILQKIFQQIIGRADLPLTICIIKEVEFYPHVDLMLERLCEALLQNSLFSTNLMPLAQCISSESMKRQVFQKIYHKFLRDQGNPPPKKPQHI